VWFFGLFIVLSLVLLISVGTKSHLSFQPASFAFGFRGAGISSTIWMTESNAVNPYAACTNHGRLVWCRDWIHFHGGLPVLHPGCGPCRQRRPPFHGACGRDCWLKYLLKGTPPSRAKPQVKREAVVRILMPWPKPLKMNIAISTAAPFTPTQQVFQPRRPRVASPCPRSLGSEETVRAMVLTLRIASSTVLAKRYRMPTIPMTML
jgi:hypothetical protein